MEFKNFKFEVVEEEGWAVMYVTKPNGEVVREILPKVDGEPPLEFAWGFFPELIKKWFDK